MTVPSPSSVSRKLRESMPSNLRHRLADVVSVHSTRTLLKMVNSSLRDDGATQVVFHRPEMLGRWPEKIIAMYPDNDVWEASTPYPVTRNGYRSVIMLPAVCIGAKGSGAKHGGMQ